MWVETVLIWWCEQTVCLKNMSYLHDDLTFFSYLLFCCGAVDIVLLLHPIDTPLRLTVIKPVATGGSAHKLILMHRNNLIRHLKISFIFVLVVQLQNVLNRKRSGGLSAGIHPHHLLRVRFWNFLRTVFWSLSWRCFRADLFTNCWVRGFQDLDHSRILLMNKWDRYHSIPDTGTNTRGDCTHSFATPPSSHLTGIHLIISALLSVCWCN